MTQKRYGYVRRHLGGRKYRVELPSGPSLSSVVEEAKSKGLCRICGKPIYLSQEETDYPERYDKAAAGVVVCGGVHITLGYGSDFAHTACQFHGEPHRGFEGNLK